jgi:hypothetical protein
MPEITGRPSPGKGPEGLAVAGRVGAGQAPTVCEANLKSVIARVRDPVESHDPPQAVDRTPADERQQSESLRDDRQKLPQILRNSYIVRALDDGCEGAIEVQEHRARRRVREKRLDQSLRILGVGHGH